MLFCMARGQTDRKSMVGMVNWGFRLRSVWCVCRTVVGVPADTVISAAGTGLTIGLFIVGEFSRFQELRTVWHSSTL